MNGKFSATCFMTAAILAAAVNYIHLTFNRAYPALVAKHSEIKYPTTAPLTETYLRGATPINFDSAGIVATCRDCRVIYQPAFHPISPDANDLIRL